jgi:hypothetical protein
MPFDALTTHLTLADAARRLGIVSIPRGVLDDHKQKELRKHPGSWWYYHTDLAAALLFFGFFISMFTAFATLIVSLGALLAGHVMSGLAFLGIGVAATVVFNRICASGVLTGRGVDIKGPAFWREYNGIGMAHYLRAPAEMLDYAKRLQRMMPGTEIVVGELLQNKISLDPYLLVRDANDEVILAIWDKSGMLHQAFLLHE